MFSARSTLLLLGTASLVSLTGCASWYDHHSSGSAQTARATPPELAPAMVQQVQASLQQQGLYRGNVDGLWGPATESAVQSYQQSHSLAATGQIDTPTLASLNLPTDGSVPAAAPPPQQSAAPAPMAPPPQQ